MIPGSTNGAGGEGRVLMSMLLLWVKGGLVLLRTLERTWRRPLNIVPLTERWGSWDIYLPSPIFHWLRVVLPGIKFQLFSKCHAGGLNKLLQPLEKATKRKSKERGVLGWEAVSAAGKLGWLKTMGQGSHSTYCHGDLATIISRCDHTTKDSQGWTRAPSPEILPDFRMGWTAGRMNIFFAFSPPSFLLSR